MSWTCENCGACGSCPDCGPSEDSPLHRKPAEQSSEVPYGKVKAGTTRYKWFGADESTLTAVELAYKRKWEAEHGKPEVPAPEEMSDEELHRIEIRLSDECSWDIAKRLLNEVLRLRKLLRAR